MQRGVILGIISYLAMTSFVLAKTATGVICGTIQDLIGAILINVHATLIDQAISLPAAIYVRERQ